MKKCIECGADLFETDESFKDTYRGEEFLVTGVKRLQCPQCDNYMVSPESANEISKQLAEQYARLNDLLTPNEIINIRKKLALTQEEFQKIIGVTGVTVCRWETGKALQSKVADNLMRAIRDYPRFAEELVARAAL